MNDFQKHIQPKDPFERAKISEIESQKEKEEQNAKELQKKKGIFLVSILSMFKKIYSLFIKSTEKEKIYYELLQAIQQFSDQLGALMKTDESENSSYIKKLSEYWIQLSAQNNIYVKTHPHIDRLDLTISEINNFYEEEEYSLGYYLKQPTIGIWQPFPFMHQLKNLHLKYQNDPENSALKKWISYLTSI